MTRNSTPTFGVAQTPGPCACSWEIVDESQVGRFRRWRPCSPPCDPFNEMTSTARACTCSWEIVHDGPDGQFRRWRPCNTLCDPFSLEARGKVGITAMDSDCLPYNTPDRSEDGGTAVTLAQDAVYGLSGGLRGETELILLADRSSGMWRLLEWHETPLGEPAFLRRRHFRDWELLGYQVEADGRLLELGFLWDEETEWTTAHLRLLGHMQDNVFVPVR